MVSKKIKVKNKSGLHLRPAGVLCNKAMAYKSLITFEYDDGEKRGIANAKSVLSILAACVKQGGEITLNCDGEDEVEAMENLSTLIESGLGE